MHRPGSPFRPAALASAVLALAALVPSSFAQSPQYTAPGSAGGTEPPTREEIEQRMEDARWRLGPLRLAPWLGLRSLTWDQNVFVEAEGETSDLTGSVGAGLTAFLPTGPDVFWIVQAMPEYLFWLDLNERNQWIGRYGAGVLGDFNRLRLQADARRVEQQQVVTIERPEEVLVNTRTATASAVLDLTSAFSVAAGVEVAELRQERPGDRAGTDLFSRLDRDETRLRGEVRFEPTDAIRAAVGVERTETDFQQGARDLSSTGTSPFTSLLLRGNRLQLDARVQRRELEPEPGSELLPVEETQGDFLLTVTPGWRFTFGLYGSRTTAYALDLAYSHLTDERLGLDVRAPFGERLDTRAYYETGTAQYEPLEPAVTPLRDDDLTAYGAEATYRIGEWLSYRAGLHQVEIDSELPGLDRDYLRITSSLVLSASDWVWQ